MAGTDLTIRISDDAEPEPPAVAAARVGDLGAFVSLCDSANLVQAYQCAAVATANGHFAIVQHLISLHAGAGIQQICMYHAARDGHLEILRRLDPAGAGSDLRHVDLCVRPAARHGRLEILRYLVSVSSAAHLLAAHKNYCTRVASENGHDDVLSYLQLLESADGGVSDDDGIFAAKRAERAVAVCRAVAV